MLLPGAMSIPNGCTVPLVVLRAGFSVNLASHQLAP